MQILKLELTLQVKSNNWYQNQQALFLNGRNGRKTQGGLSDDFYDTLTWINTVYELTTRDLREADKIKMIRCTLTARVQRPSLVFEWSEWSENTATFTLVRSACNESQFVCSRIRLCAPAHVLQGQ